MVRVFCDVKNNVKAAQSFMSRSKRLQKALTNLTKEQAQGAAHYAAKIAPEQTGALIEGIMTKPERKKGGIISWSVISKTPENKPENQNPHNKPYHWFLHMGMRGWAKNERKSGMHNYMEVTAGWIKKSYADNVRKGIRKSLR